MSDIKCKKNKIEKPILFSSLVQYFIDSINDEVNIKENKHLLKIPDLIIFALQQKYYKIYILLSSIIIINILIILIFIVLLFFNLKKK